MKICSQAQRHQAEKGFTLLELVITVVLVGILAVFISNLLVYEVDIFRYVTIRSGSLQDSRFVMQKMARELRQIIHYDSILIASEDSIRFYDSSNNMIFYKYSNNELLQNGNLLLNNLNDLQFTYFDNLGVQLATPVADPLDIRSIAINMSVIVLGKNVNSQVKVAPRSF